MITFVLDSARLNGDHYLSYVFIYQCFKLVVPQYHPKMRAELYFSHLAFFLLRRDNRLGYVPLPQWHDCYWTSGLAGIR